MNQPSLVVTVLVAVAVIGVVVLASNSSNATAKCKTIAYDRAEVRDGTVYCVREVWSPYERPEGAGTNVRGGE